MWDKLSMSDKAQYIKLGVQNGITSLDDIREVYNKYSDGGPKRVRANTSSTAEESTKLEDQVARWIDGNKHINHAYDIPYIPEKEAKINGYTVSTNALDSIAKYAGKAKFDLDEAVALSFESGWGRQPYYNYGTKGVSDRAVGNMNYHKNYGSIPSHLFVRDYEYTTGGYNKGKPYTDKAPLEHAIEYYKSGRYNSGLRVVDKETGKTLNHTQKVKKEAEKLRKDPNYQKWKKTSGLLEYTGKAQQSRDRQKAIDAENARKAQYQKDHPIKAYIKDRFGIKYDDGGYLNNSLPKDGKLKEATVIAYPEAYNNFLKSLPEYFRNTDESEYRMHRYWELHGKPKNFREALDRDMFVNANNKWHANSVAYDSEADKYEFMKYPNHPTINKELEWYNSPEGSNFRKQYYLDDVFNPYYTYNRKRDAYGNPIEDSSPYTPLIAKISDNIMYNVNGIFTDRLYDDVTDPNDPAYREGLIQRAFLINDREKQKKFITNGGHYIEGTPGDYGLVKKAVGDNKYPVYQRAKDAISRESIIPIGNVMVTRESDSAEYGNYLPLDYSLINAAPYPTAIYVDPTSINSPEGLRFYQKAWDLNDYGGAGGFTAGTFGTIADMIGSPVVQTTGFQLIPDKYTSEIIDKYLNPHMDKEGKMPYIDEATGLTYYKPGKREKTEDDYYNELEEDEEEEEVPVVGSYKEAIELYEKQTGKKVSSRRFNNGGSMYINPFQRSLLRKRIF